MTLLTDAMDLFSYNSGWDETAAETSGYIGIPINRCRIFTQFPESLVTDSLVLPFTFPVGKRDLMDAYKGNKRPAEYGPYDY